MKSMRKVWRYIAKYKKLLVITFTAMILVQALSLVAPLIVKSILDDYLVGIENPWYETTAGSAGAVMYQDTYFTQEDQTGSEVSIVIVGGSYYFVEGTIQAGERSISGDQLTITAQDGTTQTVSAIQLSSTCCSLWYQCRFVPSKRNHCIP
ncbi:MAG: hypothetical protein PHP32_03105 [Candidatus Izemoplasmatales bacterium]|nr:hypothetical protein [Candidatus Izemoplasmatales bacterium]